MTSRVAELFAEHRVHSTAQRMAVMRAVQASPHATAEEIYEQARADIGAISRQSVYDALALLVEHRLLRRIQPAGSPTRYEDRVGDNHHHMVCRTCGAVQDVSCVTGRRPCLQVNDTHGFEIDEAEIAFWGYCATCAHTRDSSAPLDSTTVQTVVPRSEASPPQSPSTINQ